MRTEFDPAKDAANRDKHGIGVRKANDRETRRYLDTPR